MASTQFTIVYSFVCPASMAQCLHYDFKSSNLHDENRGGRLCSERSDRRRHITYNPLEEIMKQRGLKVQENPFRFSTHYPGLY